MNDNQVIEHFYQSLNLFPQHNMLKEVYPQMHIPSRPYQSAHWKSIPNKYLDSNKLSQLEKLFTKKIPEIYKKWLLHSHAYQIRLGDLFIHVNEPITTIDKLITAQIPETREKDLLIIGLEGFSQRKFVIDLADDKLKIFGHKGCSGYEGLSEKIVASSFHTFLEIFDVYLQKRTYIENDDLLQLVTQVDKEALAHWQDYISDKEMWEDMDP